MMKEFSQMKLSVRGFLFVCVFLWILPPPITQAQVVDYDIVYVRAPRFGDTTNSLWPEIFHPARMDAGADLMLLHPDGSEEVLVTGGLGSVTDPFISFDGRSCYYVYFPNLQKSELNYQRRDLPKQGSDIYRIHLETRLVERLTHQEFTPNLGAGNWDESNPVDPESEYNRLGYGVMNLGPCPVPGGKVAFTSSRNAYEPTKSYTAPNLQLFVMDEDGQNVTFIAPLNIGSALHPTILRDGRLMFSSYESQGLRDRRLWGVWAIYPDGRNWAPIVSPFRPAQAFHFMTQLSNEDIVVVDYYNLNNNGFGALYRMPVAPPAGTPSFYSAFPSENPPIDQTVGAGYSYPFRMPFTRYGMHSITPFTHGNDQAAPVGADGVRVGKFTHPSAAPDNDLLCVWTPGPANDLNRPTTDPRYDAGLYILPNGAPVTHVSQLVLIKNDLNYNEAWPRAVVSYEDVHGVDEPNELPWLPNDGSLHRDLPRGTPYGIVGTSSFYKRESFPGIQKSGDSFEGLDAFNTSQNGQSSNWGTQGSDAGKYSNRDIYAVRILGMEPNTHRSYGPNYGTHFYNHANERLRIMGEIPLRKYDPDGNPILDPEGNPDTSFQAVIPADTPFTFQMIDTNGMCLTLAQTWHQVRPGEIRNDCGGCHAHSQQPLEIKDTVAGQAGYRPVDLRQVTTWLTKVGGAAQPTVTTVNKGMVDVEFLRDIRPIFQRSCVPCHTESDSNPPGNLVLDDYTLYDGLPGDYKRLCADATAEWGHPALVTYNDQPLWRQTNASRYIRKFQARRSLLVWKVFGARLDGWTNEDHPTESVPGDPTTLPPGANINDADLDYTGTIMPPPDSDVPGLTEDEKMQIARWIDLGCPINKGELVGDTQGEFGWFLDDLRPTLTVSRPKQNQNEQPLSEIRVGLCDGNSGIRDGTLSVTADFDVNGIAAGNELVGSGSFVDDGVFSISLTTPIINMTESHVIGTVFDNQGNKKTVDVRFWVEPVGEDLSMVRVDRKQLASDRVIIRMKDTSTNTHHVVYGTDDLSRPRSSWTPCTIHSYVEEVHNIRRIEVSLPSDGDQYYLMISVPSTGSD